MKTCAKCGECKSLDQFPKQKGGKGGLNSRCAACVSEQGRQWRANNSERCKAYQNKWNNHPDRKGVKLKSMYGIDSATYAAMLDRQGQVCAICGGQCCSGRSLAVDHCHTTGQVRGLLCANCNRGLGMLKDSPDRLRRAADYLEAHRG